MSQIRLYVDEDAEEHAVIPDQRYSIGEKIRRLAAFVSDVATEEMIGRMEFL